MTTSQNVAEWMVEQFNSSSNRLRQHTAAQRIIKEFGKDFVYKNKSGNWAINTEVLDNFRTLTEGQAIWERGQKAWRHLREGETYKGRQVD